VLFRSRFDQTGFKTNELIFPIFYEENIRQPE